MRLAVIQQLKALRLIALPVISNRKRNLLILTQVINALVALGSGKLIAEFIAPEQFGLYNLQFAAFTFFFSLLVGPTITFIKSSYSQLIPDYGLKPFLYVLSLLAGVLYISLLIFFRVYKSGEFINWSLYIIFFFLIPVNILVSFLADQFNVLDKIKSFSALSIVKSISGIGFLILCFFWLPRFTEGYLVLWGMQLVIGLFGVILFISKLKKFPSQSSISSKDLLKKQWIFTAPLMFLAIWSWINNYFDRYIIEAYLGLGEVGIYNANYSLGSKFFSMLNPVFLVLLTPLVYQNNSLKFKKEAIKKYAFWYFILGLSFLILIYFTTDLLGELLLSENYSEGFYIIFWIAACFLIMTATFLYETIFYARHSTKVILYGNILGAVTNILFNLMFIPAYGLNGAVAAMLASVLIRFGFIYYKFSRI
ncbi:oligosaccharide flippase family protein [Gramella sp. KN1008]|uniref:oligosaccharide flippase family protein n=1 Tax=Gramella sp. KN1008 TaxID=2529298 RepID=UPI00103C44EA|nr:oligosaccharide flippase family protein [Gramella sp. KN1008]TBW30118.1 hypothetical protein EZJ28_01580 [Gramella sp. KN1008]